MLKGPVIGPMVICGVSFLNSRLKYLSEMGVKDSKKLSPNKRMNLARLLKENCLSYKLAIVSVNEIDQRVNKKISLNRLEEFKMAEIINELQAEEIYVDAADVNEKRFEHSIRKLLKFTPKLIVSEHKADENYPIVSAASIIAKFERDSIIAGLREIYGDFGSGYTSDRKTIEFMRNWMIKEKSFPPFVRRSWETSKALAEEIIFNKKMTDFM
ncbi:MAG: ribonuclease HII [Candidatus Thorarchaeota archaeon]